MSDITSTAAGFVRDEQGKFCKQEATTTSIVEQCAAKIVEQPPAAETPIWLLDQEARPFKKKRKVAIVGFASTWNLAPFTDPDFEIWGLNELYLYFDGFPGARADRWFEIHSLQAVRDSFRDGSYFKRLSEMKIPIYMHQHFDEIPYSVPYPIDKMHEIFSINSCYKKAYLTNSIAMMTALAIYEGFEEIHIYGTDMAQETEYGTQRPSCEFFLGVAFGAGIKIHIPAGSDLLKTAHVYGYEEPEARDFEGKMKQRIVEIKGRQADGERRLQALDADYNQKRIAIIAEINQYYGAWQDSEHIYRNWHKL